MKPVLSELEGVNFNLPPVQYLEKILLDGLSSKVSIIPIFYEKVGIVCRAEYVPAYKFSIYYFPLFDAILIAHFFMGKVFMFEKKSYKYHSNVFFDLWEYKFYVLEGEK
jgi:hypothetical protein